MLNLFTICLEEHKIMDQLVVLLQLMKASGITNKDWYKTLFADGHQSATDPEFT